jgi:capsular polysaccharide biosynthesis protein
MSIDSALVLDIGGGEFFQHFLLDLLPVLNSARQFLVSNNDVKIMLPAPLPSFSTFQDWIKLLGLKNEVVVFPSDRKIDWAVNRLYFVKFNPYNYGANSSSLYQSLHKTLNSKTLDNAQGNVTYIRRNSPKLTRGYVSNEEEVISQIQSICSKKSLTFKVMDLTTTTLFEIQQTLNDSKVAISLHGGAGLNAIFLPAESTFIEALNIKNCNTFAHLMLSCGINYIPLSIAFDIFDPAVTFPITQLDSLFNDVL